jgi:hypothetical protein
VRHDPPRIVWSGVLWRDVRPMADLQREETPMIRAVLFLLGLALMAAALVLPGIPQSAGRWPEWLYGVGLLLAVGAHGWPL